MLQIGNTLVSLDLIERRFACNLGACKGVCCIEGDAGAPLEGDEAAYLREILPVIWNGLRPEAQAVIRSQGVAYIDMEGDTVTSIVDGRNCVFTTSDEQGVCLCAVEKAFREGRIPRNKPISCSLYPIRLKNYAAHCVLNYDRWRICRPAETFGRQQDIPLHIFLKEPLIRKFGQAWYDELCLTAEEWQKQAPHHYIG
ncbi:MAG: DUF3109 family protein [Tannerella sp.]|jgi:hypothetical protein|nr:DUF3109 family protein [Tannerella sp.]